MHAPSQQPVKRCRISQKSPPWYQAFRESLGSETVGANQRVYLVTFSRAFPGTVAEHRDLGEVSKANVATYIRDALDNPTVTAAGGRPRGAGDATPLVELVAVANIQNIE